VHHRLLVARQVVGQVRAAGQRGLEQRLPDAGHVAVPEDAEAAGDQPLLDAVALAVLGGEETDDCLGDRQPAGGHSSPTAVSSAASTSPSAG
jgi:hypothetical protein